jgi:hypothetical protein
MPIEDRLNLPGKAAEVVVIDLQTEKNRSSIRPLAGRRSLELTVTGAAMIPLCFTIKWT